MRLILVCIVLTGALVSPAFAHTGVGQTNSFAFPLHGADHILAMLAVGLWGVLAGGRATWVWPMAFVATMLAGFAAATAGLQMPFVEPAIWSSIVILGLLVALAVRAPVWMGAVITGSSHSFMAMSTGLKLQPLVSFLMPLDSLSPPLGFMQPVLGLGFWPNVQSGSSPYAAWVDWQCWAESL